MAFGTWRSPFPRQFGGGSTKRMSRIYRTIRSNIGNALSDDESSASVAEDRAAARALWVADRMIDRRIAQADPRKLSNMLVRWEKILGIQASSFDSDADRRARVSSRLLSHFDALSGSISRIAEEAFFPWTTQLQLSSLAEATVRWPGGTVDAAHPWYNSLCNVCIEYIRPASGTDADVDRRRSSCSAALDEVLPAWATYSLSETYYGYAFGFLAGISRSDYTCVD